MNLASNSPYATYASETESLIFLTWESVFQSSKWNCNELHNHLKVTCSNISHLEANVGIHRLLIKGMLDAYVLWPFEKKFIFELVKHDNTLDYTVMETS